MIDLSTAPLDILAEIVRQTHFTDLTALARVSRHFAGAVCSELVARIGQPNYTAMMTPRLALDERYKVAWNFMYDIADAAAYLPVARRLTWRRSSDQWLHVRYDYRCDDFRWYFLRERWLHFGLYRCALLVGSTIAYSYERQCATKDERIFWETLRYLNPLTSNNRDPDPRLHALLDQLNPGFFNYLIGIIGHLDRRVAAILVESNNRRPRYDPAFADYSGRWKHSEIYDAVAVPGPPVPIDRAVLCCPREPLRVHMCEAWRKKCRCRGHHNYHCRCVALCRRARDCCDECAAL